MERKIRIRDHRAPDNARSAISGKLGTLPRWAFEQRLKVRVKAYICMFQTEKTRRKSSLQGHFHPVYTTA